MAKRGSKPTVTPDTPKKTVYRFTSENKFLTSVGLGIQFVDGKAETDNLEVAKALCKISGVTRVED